ncbi:hypothetical protein EDD86DRAFT_212036 [Gorgonomyces haynaldii]|nr:hypothetical protein EDD86DRAFT_212036 [Gorgonomyces haynaldii]
MRNQTVMDIALTALEGSTLYLPFAMVLSLTVPYFLTGGWIAYKDLTGQWKQFDLRKKNAIQRDLFKHYLSAIPHQLVDLFLILPVGLSLACQFRGVSLTRAFTLDDLFYEPVFALVAYYTQQAYLMLAHWILHWPMFYKSIHKKHHSSLDHVHALSAWTDTFTEFILMEMVSHMILVSIMPTHWTTLCLIFAFLGHSSSIEHCGFKVNDYIDSTYHWNHHKYSIYNFAETEFFDRICGTVYVSKQE